MKLIVYWLLRIGLGVFLSAVPVLASGALSDEVSARLILESSGFSGGVCIILGDKTGGLTDALSGQYRVGQRLHLSLR